MSSGIRSISGWSIAGVYLLLAMLLVWPAVDLLTSAWPLQFASLQWRYGFLGLMAAFLHTPLLSITLAMILAFVMGHTLVLRLLAVLSFAGSILLVAVMILFALDVIQLRGSASPESLMAFQVGAVTSEAKHFTAFLVLVLIGIGGWRTASVLAHRSRPPRTSDLTAEVLKAQKRD